MIFQLSSNFQWTWLVNILTVASLIWSCASMWVILPITTEYFFFVWHFLDLNISFYPATLPPLSYECVHVKTSSETQFSEATKSGFSSRNPAVLATCFNPFSRLLDEASEKSDNNQVTEVCVCTLWNSLSSLFSLLRSSRYLTEKD